MPRETRKPLPMIRMRGLGSAVAIYCLSLDDFNRITGQNLTLGQGEIFYDSVYGKAEKALEGTLTIQGKEWKMMGAVTGLDSVKAQRVMMGSIYYLIFPDQASIEELTGEIVTNGTWNYFMGIDLDGNSKTQAEMRDSSVLPSGRKRLGKSGVYRGNGFLERKFLFPLRRHLLCGHFPGLSVSHGDGAYHLL